MANLIKNSKELVNFDDDTEIALKLEIDPFSEPTEQAVEKAKAQIDELIKMGVKPQNIALVGVEEVFSDLNSALERLTAGFGSSFGGAINALTDFASYLDDIGSIIKNKKSIAGASENAKAPDDIPIDESIVKKYARKLQKPDMLGNEQISFPDTFIAEERPIDGKTPLSDWKDRTAVSVETAGGKTITEKPSKFAAEYGRNVVVRSNTGHFIEMDDTEGAERINIQHKNGAFITIHKDKSIVIRGQDGIQIITYKDNDLFVGGNINITVMGDANISTNGNTNIDTVGDVNWKVGGDFNLDVKGDTSVFNRGNIKMTAKQIRQNAGDPRVLEDVKKKEYKLGS